MPDTKLYANSYIDPSDNQRRYFLDLEATHKDDATDPNTVLGGIKSTADNAETIAKGATRAMVFDTIAAMETWLKDAANKGKLKIGDNLYIKAVDVPDYWVSAVYETATPEGFYYNYSRLEVGTVKLSNVVTTDSQVTSSVNYLYGAQNDVSKRISIDSLKPLITGNLYFGYNTRVAVRINNPGSFNFIVSFARFTNIVGCVCIAACNFYEGSFFRKVVGSSSAYKDVSYKVYSGYVEIYFYGPFYQPFSIFVIAGVNYSVSIVDSIPEDSINLFPS